MSLVSKFLIFHFHDCWKKSIAVFFLPEDSLSCSLTISIHQQRRGPRVVDRGIPPRRGPLTTTQLTKAAAFTGAESAQETPHEKKKYPPALHSRDITHS